MKSYRLNIPLFLSIVAVISLIIVSIYELTNGQLHTPEIIDILWNYAIVTIPIAGIWVFFERIGWRLRIFRFLQPSLHLPPDLRGRWVGVFERADGSEPRRFVLEISQTLTSVTVDTYTLNSTSHSSIVDIAADATMERTFSLCYLWQGSTPKVLPGHSQESGMFRGFSILKLNDTSEEKRLVGEYFTERKPTQTRGKIRVSRESARLKGEFE